jgi:putative Mg2+ transporter-C (MgtC) family protein
METLAEHIQQWAANLGPANEALIRLILAAVAGALVGLEREIHGRQAGFRTNTLVSLGSCLVMIVSNRFAIYPWPTHASGSGVNTNIDPARVAYSVMTGIGFLGAGTIIQHRSGVLGLTTAAGLWCVAAIGLAMGFGLYLVGAMCTVIVLIVLWLLEFVQRALPKTHYRTITVRRKWAKGCVAATIDHFKAANMTIMDVSFHRTPDLSSADINLHIAFVNRQQYFDFERQLEGDHTYELLAGCDA